MSRPRKKNSITPSVATIRVTHKYRAYPTVLQEYTIENWLFILCSVYNHAIEERAEGYKNTGETISYSAQQNALPVLRKADPALRKVHSQVLQDCLQRVDKAYQKFFEDLKQKKAGAKIKVGYPRRKKLEKYRSLTYPQVWMKSKDRLTENIKIRSGEDRRSALVILPGIGGMNIRVHRAVDCRNAKTVTLKREASGAWYICVSVEKELVPTVSDNGKTTGVDVGLHKAVATSDGNFAEHPKFINKAERRLRKAQKVLSRREKGSANYQKQKGILARRHERVANRRRDFLHKLSLWLVLSYSYIAFEKLNIAAMVKNPHLAKAILDAGWGSLIRLTSYKSVMLRGNEVVRVNPAYTTQECSKCGARVPKTLTERIHKCPQCGLVLDRDTNAANVIEERAFGSSTVGRDLPEPTVLAVNACGDGTSAASASAVSLVVDPGSPDYNVASAFSRG